MLRRSQSSRETITVSETFQPESLRDEYGTEVSSGFIFLFFMAIFSVVTVGNQAIIFLSFLHGRWWVATPWMFRWGSFIAFLLFFIAISATAFGSMRMDEPYRLRTKPIPKLFVALTLVSLLEMGCLMLIPRDMGEMVLGTFLAWIVAQTVACAFYLRYILRAWKFMALLVFLCALTGVIGGFITLMPVWRA